MIIHNFLYCDFCFQLCGLIPFARVSNNSLPAPVAPYVLICPDCKSQQEQKEVDE